MRSIESELEFMLKIDAFLNSLRSEIEDELFNLLPNDSNSDCPPVLAQAVAHAVKSGGKRVRPALCLMAAAACGGDRSVAVFPACAVELLHNYTLVHDDLPCMDNDLWRRGQPTVHARFGEAIAVLTGDALLTLAFETLARTPVKNANTMVALIKELSTASGASGVIGGQVEDILAAGGELQSKQLEYIFEHKTADLFKASAALGAMCVNASKNHLDRISAYGKNIGFAFQIIDDIIDTVQSPPSRNDELSCLTLMSMDEARARAEEHTRRAVGALTALPGDTTALAHLAEMMLKRAS
jgi:geranylgeranyl diphosphate synthase, type II